MDADTKRRVRVFGVGVLLGLPLAIALFQWSQTVQEQRPRETKNVEVLLTSCALKPGDVFEARCVERRVVAEQFVPPQTIAADNSASYVGKQIWATLEVGSAVRAVDFEKPE